MHEECHLRREPARETTRAAWTREMRRRATVALTIGFEIGTSDT
jgi:hypothetical protein